LADPDVAIVGAGPAGLLVALSLRESTAVVLEASRRLGWPPHCTGIVSPSTARRLGLPEAVGEEYDCVVFMDGRGLEVCRVCGSPVAVRVRRPLLEELLASRAEERGHRVILGARVEAWGPGWIWSPRLGRLRVERAVVVAAGATAAPRWCRRAAAVELRVRLDRRVGEEDLYTFHGVPGGLYGWLVPLEGGRWALLGVAARPYSSLGEALAYMLKLVQRMWGFTVAASRRSGVLLLGPPLRSLKLSRSLYAIGDSACSSKPYTGGGLYAISLAAPAVAASVEGDDSPLERVWVALRAELELQTHLERLLRAALASGVGRWVIRALCSVAPDFDAHSTGLRLVLPGGGRP
jgi:flavin-dependent dehydrogenase